jgi:uncharacterized protein
MPRPLQEGWRAGRSQTPPAHQILKNQSRNDRRSLGPSNAKSVGDLLPRSLIEILLWIVVSITAGFCEEIAFRGYLQRPLHALSGSIGVAVVAQALVFGVAHGYQEWKQVAVISVLGVLYGALAAWRRNVRAAMVAHAGSDIWQGWLKTVVWS